MGRGPRGVSGEGGGSMKLPPPRCTPRRGLGVVSRGSALRAGCRYRHTTGANSSDVVGVLAVQGIVCRRFARRLRQERARTNHAGDYRRVC